MWAMASLRANSQPFGDWDAAENRMHKGNDKLGKDWVGFLWNSKCAGITWPFTLTLTLSTPWMHAHLETIVCKFGGDPAICLIEEAICAKSLETDRRTDGRRTTRHCISSLEWAKTDNFTWNICLRYRVKFKVWNSVVKERNAIARKF